MRARFPLDPLYRQAQLRWDAPSIPAHKGSGRGNSPGIQPDPESAGRLFSITVLGEMLGVDHKQIYRWRRYGLTTHCADRAATALGFHPADIWGMDWWDPKPLDGFEAVA